MKIMFENKDKSTLVMVIKIMLIRDGPSRELFLWSDAQYWGFAPCHHCLHKVVKMMTLVLMVGRTVMVLMMVVVKVVMMAVMLNIGALLLVITVFIR